jgi:hypothetical protein
MTPLAVNTDSAYSIKTHLPLRMLMKNDVEASQYDIGTTHIRLVRAGNVVQILFSSPLEAGFLYKELAARYKRAADKLKGA